METMVSIAKRFVEAMDLAWEVEEMTPTQLQGDDVVDGIVMIDGTRSYYLTRHKVRPGACKYPYYYSMIAYDRQYDDGSGENIEAIHFGDDFRILALLIAAVKDALQRRLELLATERTAADFALSPQEEAHVKFGLFNKTLLRI